MKTWFKTTLDIATTLAGIFFGVAVLYDNWNPDTAVGILVAAGVGFVVGLIVASFSIRKLRKQSAEQLKKEAEEYAKQVFAKEFKKHEPEIRKLAEKHRDQIEFAGLARLIEATNQCQRTGKPVKVEIGGVEEYIWITPPKGAVGNGGGAN